jgi:CDP-diacylglycerol--serine O-phosphatidyltransferase
MFILDYIDQTIRKMKANTANIITLGNLSLGSFSFIWTIKGEYNLALIFIFMAALLDRFDGLVARKLNIESELGKQLDSLCDVISFGVAPALLIYTSVLQEFSAPGAFFAIIYIACGAFRLARFNITESTGYFQGLPITAAGCLLTLSYLGAHIIPAQIYMLITLFLAFAMISTTKIKKM